jgi:hypothetical protein
MIDTSNGRINFAYSGDGAEIWWNPPAANRLPDNATIDDYLKMGGLTHTYDKLQAYTIIDGIPVKVADQSRMCAMSGQARTTVNGEQLRPFN